MSTIPVDPAVEMLIDGEWVDITADCRLGNADSGGGISITKGTPNEGSVAEPTQLDFTLNNIDGTYSIRNPLSPYFGLLGPNQPVRVALGSRSDTFARTLTDSWGTLPSRVNPEGVAVAGEKWNLYGGQAGYDVSPGAATIQAVTGNRLALFGTYGDVEVVAKVKVSNLTSEFGVVMRSSTWTAVGSPPGDFETTLSSWAASGGTSTLVISTAQFRAGARSALMTVAGSPATVTIRAAAVAAGEGRVYRTRMWVRCSIGTNITGALDWKDGAGAAISSNTTVVAVTANTWTLIEVTATAPSLTESVVYGPSIAGSPANGTLLFLDEIDLLDIDLQTWHSAYITPGAPDQLRLGRVSPGSATAFSVSQASNVVINTNYWFKAQMTGLRRRVKFWKDGDPEPTTWGLSQYDDTATTRPPGVPLAGQVGVIVKDGTALVTFSEFYVREWRAHAEITIMPPRWDLSREDRWVPIQARGILRRLGQGRKNLQSAVTLHLKSYDALSGGRWPLEENEGVERAGNAISGGQAAAILGLEFQEPEVFGALALPGVSAYANMSADTSSFTASIKPHTGSGQETVLFFFKVPQAVGSDALIATFSSSGTARNWRVYLLSTQSLRVEARDHNNALLDSATTLFYNTTSIPTGSWVACTLYLLTSGGNVVWAFNFHRPGTESFFTANGSFAGTVGIYRGIFFKSSSVITAAGGMGLAQVMHYAGDLPFVTDDFARAAYAYTGEAALARFLRLTANAGIKATTSGDSAGSTPMGPQLPNKLLDLLEECAEVEQGILEEERDDAALRIRTRASLYNQRIVELDIDAGHMSAPLEPNDDDQGTRNDVTVSRPGGGFAVSVQETGPKNIQPPEDDAQGVGIYDEAPSINYATDSQLQSIADWRRSRGTLESPRYPSITADLAANPYQTDDAASAQLRAADAGAILNIVNPEVSPDPHEQIVQQYTEKLDQYESKLTFVSQPGELWRVGVMNYTTRIQSENLVTNSSFVAGTDTLLSVNTLDPASFFVQVADAAQSFPFDILTSGVRLRVTATGRVLNSNPYFETGITGYVGDTASIFWERYRDKFKSGVGSIRGTSSAIGVFGVMTSPPLAAISAGASYQVSGWLRTSVSLADVRIVLDTFQVDGVTNTSAVFPSSIATTANTWVHFSATVVAPALSALARIRARAVATSIGDILWADDLRIMPITSFNTMPQTLTVEQTPVNGIVKTILAGSSIRVVEPWRVGW